MYTLKPHLLKFALRGPLNSTFGKLVSCIGLERDEGKDIADQYLGENVLWYLTISGVYTFCVEIFKVL